MRSLWGLVCLLGVMGLFDQPAQADAFDRNRENCSRWEQGPETAISSCTWLMGSGVLSTDSLPDVYLFRGLAYGRTGKYRDAINDFNTAIRWEPEIPYYYYARGSAYLALGERELAEYDYANAIRLDPKDFAFLSTYIGGTKTAE